MKFSKLIKVLNFDDNMVRIYQGTTSYTSLTGTCGDKEKRRDKETLLNALFKKAVVEKISCDKSCFIIHLRDKK